MKMYSNTIQVSCHIVICVCIKQKKNRPSPFDPKMPVQSAAKW